MKQLDKQLENELIKHLLVQNCLETSGGLGSYSVLHFSDYDEYGSLLLGVRESGFTTRLKLMLLLGTSVGS